MYELSWFCAQETHAYAAICYLWSYTCRCHCSYSIQHGLRYKLKSVLQYACTSIACKVASMLLPCMCSRDYIVFGKNTDVVIDEQLIC